MSAPSDITARYVDITASIGRNNQSCNYTGLLAHEDKHERALPSRIAFQ